MSVRLQSTRMATVFVLAGALLALAPIAAGTATTAADTQSSSTTAPTTNATMSPSDIDWP